MDGTSRFPYGRRAANLLIATLFLLGIGGPLVRQVTTRVAGSTATQEFRAPRSLPRLRWSAESARSFPSRFDAWYADEFGFRKELVRWHHVLRWFGFGLSPTEKVVLGKEDWLFYAEDEAIAAYRGAIPFTDHELAGWQYLLETRRDLLALGDIAYLYVIAPSKSRIYSEYMPERFDRIGPTRLDQLLTWLSVRSDIEILDLRHALALEKSGDTPGDWLYNRLGTHWNARGTLVAYRELAAALAAVVPGLVPWQDSDFSMEPKSEASDSWSGRMYMEDLLPEEERVLTLENPPRVERATDVEGAGSVRVIRTLRTDVEAPKAVFFHDSYLAGMLPIIATHFSEAVFYWGLPLTVERVRDVRPDVVADVFVDWSLRSQSPFALLPMPQGLLRKEFMASSDVQYRSVPGDWRLAPHEGAELALEGDWLEVRLGGRIGARGGVMLPELGGLSSERRILRARIVAPAATTLELLYLSERRRQYNRTDLIELPIVEGFNDVFIELADPTLEGRILLRPGRAQGRYVIMDLGVRGAPR